MAFKRATFLFMLWMLAIALKAQGHKVADSLEHALLQQGKQSERFTTLIRLSDELTNTDLPKALEYGLTALQQAEKASSNKDILRASLLLARIYYFMSDLKKAMEYAMKAKTLAEDLNLDTDIARSLDAIGSIYYDIGNQARSSESFFSSLKIYEKLKDKDGIGSTFCRIGTLYLDQKDYNKAVEYYSNSIKLARELNSLEGIASNMNNLAKVYCEKQEYAKALQNYKEALDINLKSGNYYLAGNNYLNIADVYVKQKEYPAAIAKLEQARKIFGKLGNKLRLAKSQVMLGKIYIETKQYSKCEQLAANTLNIGMEQGYNEVIVGAAGLLNKLYLSRNDSITAFRYFIIEKQYQDSLFQAEKLKTLSKLELQHQFDKTEQAAKIERQRKNMAIAIITGCLLFSLIIIILISKQLRLKAKKMQLEKESHEKELDYKNKEMTLNVMSLMKKNEIFSSISEKLMIVAKEASSPETKTAIKKIGREIQKGQENEIWKEFSLRFREIHHDFYNSLLHKYPNLTPSEQKLCAFLRLNLTTKEISELTGQSISTIEIARHRLRQKLGISNSEVNLITFLSQI